MKSQLLSIELIRDGSCKFIVETPTSELWVVGFPQPDPYILKEQYANAILAFTDMYFAESCEKDINGYFGYLTRKLAQNLFHLPLYVATDRNQERKRIGERIKDLRKKKEMDAKTLARLSEITPANLCRIEQGKYSPGLDILVKIATALDAKIDFVPN